MSENLREPPHLGYVFALAFLILEISSGFIAFNATLQSADGKAWWPALLTFDAVLNGIYSGLICLVYLRIFRPKLKATVLITSLLSILLLLKGIAFYAVKIDWLSVNNGIKSLSLFERIVISPATEFGLYICFIVGTFLYCAFLKKRTT